MQALLDRRDEVIHGLDDSVAAAVARGPRDRARCAAAGGSPASAASPSSSSDGGTRSSRRQGGLPRRRHAAAMPPIEGLDQIDDAWTNRDSTTAKADPGLDGDPGRRRGRRRDVAGLRLARRAGRARRGRAQAAPARGVVRLRAGAGVARGAGRRRPPRPERRARLARRTARCACTSATARRSRGRRAARRARRTAQTERLGLEDLGFEGGKYVEVDEHYVVPGTTGCT